MQGIGSAGSASDYPRDAGEPLTAGEISFIKSIFGNEVKTDCIRKHFTFKSHATACAGTFNASTVQFYTSELFSLDYSQTKDIFKYGVFIHEMTHVWQHNHPLRKVLHDIRHPSLKHDYKLTERSRFDSFGTEQQGYIIEDYARNFLFQGKGHFVVGDKYFPSLTHEFNDKSLQKLSLLQKVVEDRFPEARKTRLALEARMKAALPPPPPSAPPAPIS